MRQKLDDIRREISDTRQEAKDCKSPLHGPHDALRDKLAELLVAEDKAWREMVEARLEVLEGKH